MSKEVNAFVRQMKIDMITDTPNPIADWFNSLWNQLIPLEISVYTHEDCEIIYYLEDLFAFEWIFYMNSKTTHINFNYIMYWDILNLKFGLSIDDIDPIVEFLYVENKMNITTGTIYNSGSNTNLIDRKLEYYERNVINKSQ